LLRREAELPYILLIKTPCHHFVNKLRHCLCRRRLWQQVVLVVLDEEDGCHLLYSVRSRKCYQE